MAVKDVLKVNEKALVLLDSQCLWKRTPMNEFDLILEVPSCSSLKSVQVVAR